MGFALNDQDIEQIRRTTKQDIVMHSAGEFDLRTCLRIFDMVDAMIEDRPVLAGKKPGEA